MKGRKPKPGKALPAYMRVISAQETPEEGARAEKEAGTVGEVRRFEAPDWFDARDKAIFEFLQDQGNRLGILDAIDQIELQMLAREVGEWQRCQEEISAWREKTMQELDSKGLPRYPGGTLTYKNTGRNGVQYKTIPQVHQASQHLRNIAALASNFGMSPVDRERLKFFSRTPGDGEQGNLLD
jgi:P27 family predicted phage terminase small subunit